MSLPDLFRQSSTYFLRFLDHRDKPGDDILKWVGTFESDTEEKFFIALRDAPPDQARVALRMKKNFVSKDEVMQSKHPIQ